MMLKDQVFAQAALLAGELTQKQTELLRMLCLVSSSSLASQLRQGLTVEDCKAEFIAAASLYALASLNSVAEDSDVSEFKAGDLTVKKGSAGKDAASRCLLRQAEMILSPFLKDRFVFQGV